MKKPKGRINNCFGGLLLALSCSAGNALAQPSIIETLESLKPSLVNITAESAGTFQSPHASAAFDKTTGRLIVLRNVKTAYYNRKGAGVIIDSSGIIVTNFHTIHHSDKITITLNNSSEFSATVLKTWPDEDLALLKINVPESLVTVEFINSDTLGLGQEVFTVGSSELLDQTISEGKIIGLGSHRTQNSSDSERTDMLQINMNLYKGDSGGPLFDHRGQFVGMIAAGQAETDRSTFAIPANKIRKLFMAFSPPKIK